MVMAPDHYIHKLRPSTHLVSFHRTVVRSYDNTTKFKHSTNLSTNDSNYHSSVLHFIVIGFVYPSYCRTIVWSYNENKLDGLDNRTVQFWAHGLFATTLLLHLGALSVDFSTHMSDRSYTPYRLNWIVYCVCISSRTYMYCNGEMVSGPTVLVRGDMASKVKRTF